ALDRAAVEERRARGTASHAARRKSWQDAAAAGEGASPVDFAWLASAIGRILDDETICVNEYDLLPQFLDFERPGSYFSYPPSGGLGWGLGAALGAKLAAPDKTVVCCVGDGSYLFGEPLTAHWLSRARNLPVLFVVFDNEAWNAVKVSTGMVYPEGATLAAPSVPFSDLRPQGRFDQVVGAFGGHGERVERGAEVLPALRRALRVVREERRQALVQVSCAR
ncbi:MAG: thiamine pyrophosphate-dependent enzyme, partial [Candidatus Binatia bacterium]